MDFQEFTLLLEGCLRAYAEKLAIKPPALPFTERTIGGSGSIKTFLGLDPETCRYAVLDGSALPSISEFHPVAPANPAPDMAHIHGGINDSARILGRIEKVQRCEISDLFARWLVAERRRDAPDTRKHFVDGIARRILALTPDPFPGAQPPTIETDEWRCILLEGIESGSFSWAAAEVFTAAGEAANSTYQPSERFTDLLLGARLCGHVEGLAHFPMKEIVMRFSGKSDPDSNAVLAGEFGRAIAVAALGQTDLWTSSTDAIVPGLHEHLSQAKPARDPEPPPAVPAFGG
jgi:hypothetical protein